MKRGGKNVYLGNFATAEEAALCYARTPDAQAPLSTCTCTCDMCMCMWTLHMHTAVHDMSLLRMSGLCVGRAGVA